MSLNIMTERPISLALRLRGDDGLIEETTFIHIDALETPRIGESMLIEKDLYQVVDIMRQYTMDRSTYGLAVEQNCLVIVKKL